jgi:hypothetical protein
MSFARCLPVSGYILAIKRLRHMLRNRYAVLVVTELALALGVAIEAVWASVHLQAAVFRAEPNEAPPALELPLAKHSSVFDFGQKKGKFSFVKLLSNHIGYLTNRPWEFSDFEVFAGGKPRNIEHLSCVAPEPVVVLFPVHIRDFFMAPIERHREIVNPGDLRRDFTLIDHPNSISNSPTNLHHQEWALKLFHGCIALNRSSCALLGRENRLLDETVLRSHRSQGIASQARLLYHDPRLLIDGVVGMPHQFRLAPINADLDAQSHELKKRGASYNGSETDIPSVATFALIYFGGMVGGFLLAIGGVCLYDKRHFFGASLVGLGVCAAIRATVFFMWWTYQKENSESTDSHWSQEFKHG